MTLSEHADQAVANLRRRQTDVLQVRSMWFGRARTGIQIRDKKFYILRNGDYVRGEKCKDGVLIEYADGRTERIYND